jgi:NADPH-dependent 2,4-dienoyl-CoA reductase/sulfur reductase-like enzyme/nitrite reductase/ring-hydroxylating ferredoxin subunit
MLSREATMSTDANTPEGPDFEQGIDAADLKDGEMIAGRVGEEAVLLARCGRNVFAVGGTCTHYGGHLARGIVDGTTVRCPLHHARFDLANGEALSAPALRSLPCWNVEQHGNRLRVTTMRTAGATENAPAQTPRSIVIVGGGAAGHAAAETLRGRGYRGQLTMLSADTDPPCDRPNLSKDYLAGTAPEDWIPLRPPEFFTENRIDLVLGARVTSLDVATRRAVVEGGRTYAFDALLLATGAEPVRLTIPGSERAHVHYLRTLADARAIIAKLASTRRVVVVGAGFIGLEVAASLRARGIAVDVVGPNAQPLEHALGPDLARFVRATHEEHGVAFHLGQSVTAIERDAVVLANGERLAADRVVVGIGVRPRVEIAESAGLAVDDGILVDEYLATNVAGIFAAGDVARWPDPRSPRPIRVEHWVVAERQGQIAARNMMGERIPCRFPPFFWSQHYDVQISQVGHAQRGDLSEVKGKPQERSFIVAFRGNGKIHAVATVGRDEQCLRAELALERQDQAALAAIVT